jgi:hypothetical protein
MVRRHCYAGGFNITAALPRNMPVLAGCRRSRLGAEDSSNSHSFKWMWMIIVVVFSIVWTAAFGWGIFG